MYNLQKILFGGKMKNLRAITRSLSIILALLLALSALASCGGNSQGLDLSQNDPFYTPTETTSAEPSSDESSSEQSFVEDDETTADTEIDTEIEITDTEDVTEETTDTEDTKIPEETTPEETTEPEQTYPSEVDGLTFMYAPISGTSSCTVNAILGASPELEIPSEIDGYTVTALSGSAFSFAKNITSITLPPTLNMIADGAFSPCTALQTVNISDINAWLAIDFKSQSASPMYRARQILLNGQPIFEIIIPDGVTEIKDYAFYNFRSINTVRFSSDVASVGVYAFSGSGVRNVYVPTLSDWFEMTFANTTASPLASAKNLFVGDKKVNDVVVPEDITKINSFAFCGFSGLYSIEIHSGIQSIGASAFLDCPSLSAVIIRDVGSWCTTAFENESSNPLAIAKNLYFNNGSSVYPLTAVEIPASIVAISPYAFCGAINISTVAFAAGSQLTTIGSGAFKNCLNLTTIYLPDTVTVIESLAFSTCPNINYFKINGANYLGSFTNPQLALISIIDIDSLTSFKIPNTTKIIYQAAFSYCVSLESIVIPDSVIYIGNSAFYNCSSLKSATIGNGITEIGSSTFSNCSSLLSVTVPDSVKRIGRSAFSGCSAMTSLTLSSNLTYIDQYAFRDCKKISEVSIPAGVNYIGSCAFLGCKNLGSVAFGNLNNWYAGTNKISSTDLSSLSVAAYYLTEDYLLMIWEKK